MNIKAVFQTIGQILGGTGVLVILFLLAGGISQIALAIPIYVSLIIVCITVIMLFSMLIIGLYRDTLKNIDK